jgi:hypothetical protein
VRRLDDQPAEDHAPPNTSICIHVSSHIPPGFRKCRNVPYVNLNMRAASQSVVASEVSRCMPIGTRRLRCP